MQHVKALTFDLFGTVLNLADSLTPHIAAYLKSRNSSISLDAFWQQWRQLQRIEQYQDNIVLMGHSGYQTVAQRSCIYTLKRNGFTAESAGVDQLMAPWQLLSLFSEVVPALQRLKQRYRLVALSNGELDFLQHLAAN